MQGFKAANAAKPRKQPKVRAITGSYQRYLVWEAKKDAAMKEEEKK